MKEIKNYLNEASFDKWYNITDDVKIEFKALLSRANDEEYKYKTYDFMCDILKCFDVNESSYQNYIDKELFKEIKDLRYKIRDKYL